MLQEISDVLWALAVVNCKAETVGTGNELCALEFRGACWFCVA
jgi:hypothetical protein